MTRTLVWCLLGVFALACPRSPEATFYTLFPEQGQSFDTQPLRIELRRPSLPSYLERQQIVRRVEPERLDLESDERWGAPLEEMVSGTLLENLAQRLPNSIVYAESGTISTSPDAVIELALQRFELTADGEVELVAQVATHWSNAPEATRLQRYALSQRPDGSTTSAMIAAMSQLLGQLSDAIGQSLTTPVHPPAALSSQADSQAVK